jgi:hypothetical protein
MSLFKGIWKEEACCNKEHLKELWSSEKGSVGIGFRVLKLSTIDVCLGRENGMIRKFSVFQSVSFSFSFLVLWIHKMIMFY